jgi:hypothetical protein
MEVSGQILAPEALHPGKELRIPIVKEAVWAPRPFWIRWKGEKSQPLPGIEIVHVHIASFKL